MFEVGGVAWGGGLPWADFKRRTVLFPSCKELIFIDCPLLHCIYAAGRVINVSSSPCREGLAHIHWQCWLLHFGGSGAGPHGSDLFWISFNATSGTQSKATSPPLFLAHTVPAFSVVEGSLMSLMLSASGRPCLCLPCIFLYKPLMGFSFSGSSSLVREARRDGERRACVIAVSPRKASCVQACPYSPPPPPPPPLVQLLLHKLYRFYFQMEKLRHR